MSKKKKMSILSWIEDKKRLKLLSAPKHVIARGDTPQDSSKGLWTRCDKCGVILYIKHLKENQRVCFGCSYHLQMMSGERIQNLLDRVDLNHSSSRFNFHTNLSRRERESSSKTSYKSDICTCKPTLKKEGIGLSNSSRPGVHRSFSQKNELQKENMVSTWRPLDETVSPCDPLKFHDQKAYGARLEDAQERTGLQDAIQTGTGMIDGIPIALAVMDFSFMGGSMGSVVGEKITRLIEYATGEGLTLIIVSASGGARMQEGVFSLMQMAKISSALQIYQSCAKLLYISILTSPTTGGVTASFAMLGDIIFAEPKALIAFAGRRVIEQTLCEDLPDDFQTSEYMLHHGLVDLIVPRRFLRQALSETIRLYQNAPFKKRGEIPFGIQNPITFLTEEKIRRQWGKLTKRGTNSFAFEQNSFSIKDSGARLSNADKNSFRISNIDGERLYREILTSFQVMLALFFSGNTQKQNEQFLLDKTLSRAKVKNKNRTIFIRQQETGIFGQPLQKSFLIGKNKVSSFFSNHDYLISAPKEQPAMRAKEYKKNQLLAPFLKVACKTELCNATYKAPRLSPFATFAQRKVERKESNKGYKVLENRDSLLSKTVQKGVYQKLTRDLYRNPLQNSFVSSINENGNIPISDMKSFLQTKSVTSFAGFSKNKAFSSMTYNKGKALWGKRRFSAIQNLKSKTSLYKKFSSARKFTKRLKHVEENAFFQKSLAPNLSNLSFGDSGVTLESGFCKQNINNVGVSQFARKLGYAEGIASTNPGILLHSFRSFSETTCKASDTSTTDSFRLGPLRGKKMKDSEGVLTLADFYLQIFDLHAKASNTKDSYGVRSFNSKIKNPEGVSRFVKRLISSQKLRFVSQLAFIIKQSSAFARGESVTRPGNEGGFSFKKTNRANKYKFPISTCKPSLLSSKPFGEKKSSKNEYNLINRSGIGMIRNIYFRQRALFFVQDKNLVYNENRLDKKQSFISSQNFVHTQENFSQLSREGKHFKNSSSLSLKSTSNDIDFLNQAIELAATESVEWRAFYLHQQLSENMGFLEDFLPQKKDSQRKVGNMLFYKSICRSKKGLDE